MMDHCGFPKKCLGEGRLGIEGVVRGLDAVIDMSEQELSLCTLYFFLSLPFFVQITSPHHSHQMSQRSQVCAVV